MSNLKKTLKNILPEPVMAAVRETRDAFGRLEQWPEANFHPWRRDTIRRLANLKDVHRGERCFINGQWPQPEANRFKPPAR